MVFNVSLHHGLKVQLAWHFFHIFPAVVLVMMTPATMLGVLGILGVTVVLVNILLGHFSCNEIFVCGFLSMKLVVAATFNCFLKWNTYSFAVS